MKRLVSVNPDGSEVWEEVQTTLDFGVDPQQYPPLTEEQMEAMLQTLQYLATTLHPEEEDPS